MRCDRLFTVLLAILLLPAADGRAQEWTRFRGPNGTGVSTARSIPVTWTDADYLWQTRLPGKGHGSPVVWGRKLFLLSADPDSATRYVICIDTNTGETLWQRDYAAAPHVLNALNSYASSTPAVDEQCVYVAWGTGDRLVLRALDHDGREVWMRDLGVYVCEHGFGNSPIVYEDLVILVNSQQAEELAPDQQPGSSSVMAFDRETGQLRWETPRTVARVCYSTPCIYQPPEGPPELICYDKGHGFYSLDPRTGAENWSLPVFTLRTVASPIIVGDLVFGCAGSGAGGHYLIAARLGQQPHEVYRVTRLVPYITTSIARGDLVFLCVDRGLVSCMQAADGTIVWSKRLSHGFAGSPVLVDGKLYIIDIDGQVLVLAAEREFKQLGRVALGEPSRATPAVAGGRMFLRTESQLFCIGGER
ncbi:MAG: PQQ-binding-like beta-propeller repeat protein [Planctomycetaceae bacterium]|nr:PQQ-binding-like beta-propeller repeat protein [Planctomycetaceae bacterium]